MTANFQNTLRGQTQDDSYNDWQEYSYYITAEDAINQISLKLLARAKLWSEQQ